MYGSQTILESSQAPPPNNCLRSVHCHYRSLYLIYYCNCHFPNNFLFIIFLNRENLCRFFWYRSLLFSGNRLSVNFCADSHNSGSGVHSISLLHIILFVKKSKQMSIWFDFSLLTFNFMKMLYLPYGLSDS
jgi:hypothetical protein